MKIKLSHIANLILSGFALLLFAANLRTELAGEHFNLRTGTGATILTVFLVAGVVVQLGKLAQGHENAFELTITLFLLVVHVVGDVVIWYRTQIMDVPLPAEIPFLIIGGYWLIGVIDFASMFLPSQLKLYVRGYKTPQQQLLDMQRQVLELQAEKTIRDRQKEQQREQRQNPRTALPAPSKTPVSKTVQRQDKLHAILTDEPETPIAEVARQLGVKSRGTVYNDFEVLARQGRAVKEGDNWRMLTPTNGHSAKEQ
jgi:hypothetical protein